MTAIPGAPTTELGAPSRIVAPTGWPGAAVYDEQERVRDLTWPRSVKVTYPAMMNDAQIDGMYRAMTWAIRAFDWWLEPNGAPPATVDRISADYNLPVGRGTEFNLRRSQQRFRFDQHLEDALRAIGLGHYPFEQVFEVLQDGPAGVNAGWVAHLRKLAPRPPRTITEIRAAADGGLDYIKVPALRPQDPVMGSLVREVKLPVDRVVMYVWDKEGANWRGRSMLRSLHRPWKLKDTVMRVGAINIDRAGGVPYATAPQEADPRTRDSIMEVLRNFRVGEESAAVFPYGTELKFASAAGGDQAVNYVKLQNEEMARAWLLTFMQLGQTQSGSRALAEPLIDYVKLGHEVVARWFTGVFNEHVIEDDIELNEGPDQQYAPLLRCAAKGDPLDSLAGALDDAASAGALPADSGALAMVQAARASAGGRSRQRPFRVGVAADDTPGNIFGPAPAPALPPALSREPFPHEQVVDWAGMQVAVLAARQALVEHWQGVRTRQAAELVEQVEQAASLDELVEIAATAEGGDVIADHMHQLAQLGAQAVTAEAAAQGAGFDAPDLAAVNETLTARAMVVADGMARALSEAASREAVANAGGALVAAEVAAEVADHLAGLSNAFLEEQLGGALHAGLNAGRFGAMEAAPADARWLGSALMDSNVCAPCAADDGREFDSLEDMRRVYPVAGNVACLGRLRCRCTGVMVLGEAPATVQ